MQDDIRAGHITGLIFSKLARLARNTKELLEFADYFRDEHADLISLAESIDTSSPAGRLFYTMVAAMAQWEREEIAERVAASVPIRAKMGKPLGGQPPFGYRWDDGKLIPDPNEAPVRKLLYELFRDHKRKKTVARLLNERGFRTRSGQAFTDTTVGRLVEDPTAKGLRRANYTVSVDSKRSWKRKPESEWVHHEVPAIVSEALWDECNAVLLGRKGTGKKRTTIEVRHLFAGLTYCQCGTKMYVPSNTPKYVCQSCRNKIPVVDLDAVFHEQLKTFFFAPDEITKHLDAFAGMVKDKESQLDVLEKERRKLSAETDKLYALYQSDAIDKRGFAERYRPLTERLDQLDAELPELQAEVDFLKITQLSQSEIVSAARDLYSQWPNLSHPEKRDIVEAITERIVVFNGEIEITLLYTPTIPKQGTGSGGGPKTGEPGPLPGSSSQTHGKGATRSQGRVALLPFTKVVRTVRSRPAPRSVGEHLREMRLRRGLLQREVARLIGVTEDTIHNWETGQTTPLPKDGPAIVRFLGFQPFPIETLAEQLYAVRFVNGWTQEEAAIEAGVSEDGWQAWEGGCMPSPGKMRRLAGLVRNLAIATGVLQHLA
jgi:site-specific DNA recombinase